MGVVATLNQIVGILFSLHIFLIGVEKSFDLMLVFGTPSGRFEFNLSTVVVLVVLHGHHALISELILSEIAHISIRSVTGVVLFILLQVNVLFRIWSHLD